MSASQDLQEADPRSFISYPANESKRDDCQFTLRMHGHGPECTNEAHRQKKLRPTQAPIKSGDFSPPKSLPKGSHIRSFRIFESTD